MEILNLEAIIDKYNLNVSKIDFKPGLELRTLTSNGFTVEGETPRTMFKTPEEAITSYIGYMEQLCNNHLTGIQWTVQPEVKLLRLDTCSYFTKPEGEDCECCPRGEGWYVWSRGVFLY